MLSSYRASDVVAAEQPLLRAGRPLMAHAARAVALTVVREVRRRRGRLAGARVLVLVGSGSNGGDGLLAAADLAARGMSVTAVVAGSRVHPEAAEVARRGGVALVPLAEAGPAAALWRGCDVVIDALTGTGATGGLRGASAALVADLLQRWEASSSPRPVVVAVDVPSGIGVDDGSVAGPVLPADVTVTMGAAKPGLLLPPAALLAGRVEVVDLGLDLTEAGPAVVRLEARDVAGLWPVPGPADHKYSRGVLGVVAGSSLYPGAAVLATSAAAPLVGMVRYVGPDAVVDAVLARRPEVVHGDGRVQAWLVGSGIGVDDAARLAEAGEVLARALAEPVPVVLDAGALDLLPADVAFGAHVVLVPHTGELARLLSRRGAPSSREDVEARPAEHLRRAVELTGATVLLKGAVTLVASPVAGPPIHSQAEATPWLATAGAGDVLAGVVGAALAGRSADVLADPALAARLAAAAVLLHGRAARAAGGGGAGGPISAGDLIEQLGPMLTATLED